MPSLVVGPLRVARAALVATLVLALTAFAHRVAGGALPDPLVLAALAAFTLAGTTAAARLRFTPARLVVLLGGAQVALHQALVVLAPGASCVPTGVTSGHGAHAASVGDVVCAAPVGTPVLSDGGASLVHPEHLTTSGTAGLWMVLAHGTATVVLALVLARGERALERFLAWVTPLAALRAPVPVRSGARPGVAPVRTVHVASRWRSRRAPTRGPPRPAGPSGALLRPLAAS
ncbi:hypothetical protein [Cellulosimicrobium protaetiae]|uniref:Uncharacterized protein n=1 Tax=Cellulosimicrobium protaetiae TaxID=2587808 RepID=A0A6M5U8Y2_9MICO|nr:hypothetical protein [Cellulosimicrobium protaetiae]QJW34956.1 hypothetical protein FIC82_000810 [Cellulosimicrobium protaetiae]